MEFAPWQNQTLLHLRLVVKHVVSVLPSAIAGRLRDSNINCEFVFSPSLEHTVDKQKVHGTKTDKQISKLV